MTEIFTEITVDAPPETVWSVLTEFERYGEWNPALAVEGRPAEGERLTVSPGPEAPEGPTFRPRVLTVDPGREFVWMGHLFVPGLFDGRHSFRIEDLGDGRSRVVQSERFGGVLRWPILRRYGADTEANFHAMNAALKTRAEAMAAGELTTGRGVAASEPTTGRGDGGSTHDGSAADADPAEA